MSSKDSIYEGLKYPIHKLEDGESVILKWPDLAVNAPIFSDASDLPQGLDPELLMKYLILMYTPGSPAIEQHQHLGKRKTWVLSELGIEPDPKTQTYIPAINDMVLMRSAGVRKKAVTFLRLQHPADWAIMCHAERELSELLETPMPTTVNEQGKEVLDVMEAQKKRALIEATRKQLIEAQNRILDGVRIASIEQAVHEFRAQSNLGIRIEEIVLMGFDNTKPHLQTADRIFPEVGN